MLVVGADVGKEGDIKGSSDELLFGESTVLGLFIKVVSKSEDGRGLGGVDDAMDSS